MKSIVIVEYQNRQCDAHGKHGVGVKSECARAFLAECECRQCPATAPQHSLAVSLGTSSIPGP